MYLQFEALEDFFSDPLKSGYAKGLTYTLRPHTIVNEKGEAEEIPADKTVLAGEVRKWLAMDPPRVRILVETHAGASAASAGGKIAGVGSVSDTPTAGKGKK